LSIIVSEKLWVDLLKDAGERAILHPCRWSGCPAVLDNQSRLQSHLEILHAGEDTANFQGSNEFFICQWSDCKKEFQDLDRFKRHLERHARPTLLCAVEGCPKQFTRLQELVRHWHVDHRTVTDEDIRPFPKPHKLKVGDLPELPNLLPSYLTTNLQIHGCPLAKDNRKKLGPWVLRNNFGITPQWRYDLLKEIPEISQEENELIRGGEYDFLISTPMYVPIEEALPTREASRIAASGENYLVGCPSLKRGG